MADSVVVGGWMFATEKHLGCCFIIAILVLFAATILYVQIINFVCLVQERFIFYSNKTRRHPRRGRILYELSVGLIKSYLHLNYVCVMHRLSVQATPAYSQSPSQQQQSILKRPWIRVWIKNK